LLAAAAAGGTLLAPNAELAAALFEAIEQVHRDAGEEVWRTPQVRDYSSWLRECHAQRQLLDADLPRALADIEERELWRSVIDAAVRGRDFLDPAGAARAARRARRTLREYAIPLQALAAERSEEVDAFLEWNQAFDLRCRELDCISADALLNHQAAPHQPLHWIESPHWYPAARQWLERHGTALTAPEVSHSDVSVLHASSAQEELAAMADWAQRELAMQGFRAWICVPDLRRRRAEVIDALDAKLAPHRFGLGEAGMAPYAVAGGTPLAGYASVRAALEVLAASLGAVAFARFSALLRAPELQESEADAGSAARLDVLLRRRALNEADLATWLDLSERISRAEKLAVPAVVQRLRTVQQLLDFPGTRLCSEWVSIWLNALQAGPWSFRARWSSVEYQAAERLREILATMAGADAVFGPQTRAAAQSILSRAAGETPFQEQTGVPAVRVSGQLLDPWLNYDGLWICGCSDERWPPPSAPVALLPVALQRRFGVIPASADSQLRMAADLQHRWRKRAEGCFFSYADSAESGPGSASPLLPKRASEAMAAAVASPQPLWQAMYESAPAPEILWDELAPPLATDEHVGGVATLRAQSRCAFRGFAESRLQARALEQPTPGFNERERGELVHHALEHVWSRLRSSADLRGLQGDAQWRLLDTAAGHALAIVCKRRNPGERWRRRERLRLQNLLGKWLELERVRAPFVVEALEGRIRVTRFAGLDFEVRIDRVDQLEDGARVLLDYKTGAARPDWRGERPDNPQLPIYALLKPDELIAVAYAKVNAADPGFVAESQRSNIFFPRSRASKLEGRASFRDLVDAWSLRLERIAAEFVGGHAEVAPTAQACQSCDLQELCRVPAALEETDDSDESDE
jgi:probable DNA repair protein